MKGQLAEGPARLSARPHAPPSQPAHWLPSGAVDWDAGLSWQQLFSRLVTEEDNKRKTMTKEAEEPRANHQGGQEVNVSSDLARAER